MPRQSAGILLYRFRDDEIEVLLARPGGPTWRNRDLGAWTIPKGEIEGDDDALSTAVRELKEEIGLVANGTPVPLGTITQKGGKKVHAFALNQDFDPAKLQSNTFQMEWPPRSGRMQEFPEVDIAEWFDLETARKKILERQDELIDRLLVVLGES